MMNSEIIRHEQLSYWQLVFGQSKVNGAPYDGEKLIHQKWNWPRDTFLQRRRQLLRAQQIVASANLN